MSPKQAEAARKRHAEFLAQRSRYAKIDSRERKIEALALDGTPDARKQRRKMNDQIIPKRGAALHEFWLGAKGKGKVKMRGQGCDAGRINSNLNAKARIPV